MRSLLPADRWTQIETLFLAAAELPSGEWPLFLRRECPNDPQLREEVLSLLRHDAAQEPPLLDALHASAASILEDEPPPGRMLGPYRLEREIGRGGMAVVYLAARADGEFQKRVAVKIIKRGMDTATVIQRLRREQRILAALEHTSIARLLDAGTTSDGRPWIAMDYIDGLPINRFCDERRLSAEERCRLIDKVCDAVAYAHRHLVVHRDLKPTNILVTADGTPKLLDFGIAKLLTEDDGDSREPLTRGPGLPLTPEYASPEQLQGAPVTTASDVYSLGVIFFEVLTGDRPRTQQKPSALPNLPPRTRRRLAGDLDNIVLMALHADLSRRYHSAEHLAQDIRRHLQGLPVHARPDTLLYRTGKFLRRNRAAVATALLLTATVITGAAIDIRQAHAARDRFDQLRGFARTVLVDINAQLLDIPGTANARKALVGYVDDYLKRVAAQHAGDDTALATEFATTYLRLGEMQGTTPEAVASFESGLRLLERKQNTKAYDPADSLLTARLLAREGSTLIDLGRAPDGIERLNQAVALAGTQTARGWNSEAELVKAFGTWRLARVARVQQRLVEAERQARTAIATDQEILRRGTRTKEAYEILTGARNVLAAAERRQARFEESMATYREVLADIEQRAQAEPGSASLQREMARSHQILGDMVVRMPHHDENEVLFHVRRAIAIAERLAALDPGDKTAQLDLAEYLSSGGETLLEPAEMRESLGYSRRALPIFATLLKREPDNNDLRLYAALTEADLGERLGRVHSQDESILWLRRGMADLAGLLDSDPSNTTNLLEFIKVRQWLSLSLARAGQEAEARSLAQDAIDRARKLTANRAATPESLRELPRAYAAMAETCDALHNRAEAHKWYRVAATEWDGLTSRGVQFPDSAAEIQYARSH